MHAAGGFSAFYFFRIEIYGRITIDDIDEY